MYCTVSHWDFSAEYSHQVELGVWCVLACGATGGLLGIHFAHLGQVGRNLCELFLEKMVITGLSQCVGALLAWPMRGGQGPILLI